MPPPFAAPPFPLALTILMSVNANTLKHVMLENSHCVELSIHNSHQLQSLTIEHLTELKAELEMGSILIRQYLRETYPQT